MKKRVWEEKSDYAGAKIIKVFGDKSKKPEILFVGDSFAQHYLPYLDLAGQMYHFSFKAIILHQCPMIKGVDKNYSDNLLLKKSCEEEMPNEIETNLKDFQIVMYSSNWSSYDSKNFFIDKKDLFENFLVFAKDLKAMGKELIVLDRVQGLNKAEFDRYFDFYLKGKKFYSDNLLNEIQKNVNSVVREKIGNNAIFYNPLNGLTEQQFKEWPLYRGLMTSADTGHLNGFVTRQWAQEVLPKQKDFWEGILKIIDDNSTK